MTRKERRLQKQNDYHASIRYDIAYAKSVKLSHDGTLHAPTLQLRKWARTPHLAYKLSNAYRQKGSDTD